MPLLHRPAQFHDKSMRLAMACGYRVFVCSNMAFAGDFTPVLTKHSKSFSLIDCVSVGVDRMQRNFEPMRKQVKARQRSESTDVTAKVVIYEAFVEGKLRHRNIWCARCTTCTSSRNTRNFGHEQFGASPTRSLRRSRNWTRYPQFKSTAKLG